jgi:hypothetical protein
MTENSESPRSWRDRLQSRKWWTSIGMAIITLAAGFGFDLDPEVVLSIAGGLCAIYVAVEGIIDAVKK